MNPIMTTGTLSVSEQQRLSWLGLMIAAREWLGSQQEMVGIADARRLAFSHFLYSSGRLNEGLPEGTRP